MFFLISDFHYEKEMSSIYHIYSFLLNCLLFGLSCLFTFLTSATAMVAGSSISSRFPFPLPRIFLPHILRIRAGTFLGDSGSARNPFRSLKDKAWDFFSLCENACIKSHHSDIFMVQLKSTFLRGGRGSLIFLSLVSGQASFGCIYYRRNKH